jgi:hypothetical protein
MNSNSSREPHHNDPAESGFTLLEVLISTVILMFIGIAIYQTTTKTFELRDVLSNEGDFYNGIRLSMQIMQRDIALMYSPTMILPNWPQPSASAQPQPGANPQANPQNLSAQDQQDLQSGENAQTLQFWGPMVDKSGVRPMRFVGTENKMSFISVSNIRIYRDTPESDFAKVVYELVRDEANEDVPDAMLLVKTSSPNVWEEEERNDKFRKTFPILHGIKKIQFQYWRKDKPKEFINSWDSDREETKNQYPDMVRITVEVHGPSHLEFDGVYNFRPEVPLNGISPSG